MEKFLTCINFKCLDAKSCPEHTNGFCSGQGSEGYKMCGCEACIEYRIVGPNMFCNLDKHFEVIPPKLSHNISYDLETDTWSESDDYIKYP